MDAEMDKKMLEYRKKHFAVEVSPAEHPMEYGELKLSVTHNGNQWYSIVLTKDEVKAVMDALSANGESSHERSAAKNA